MLTRQNRIWILNLTALVILTVLLLTGLLWLFGRNWGGNM